MTLNLPIRAAWLYDLLQPTYTNFWSVINAATPYHHTVGLGLRSSYFFWCQ
jgi:hypothetical protein